MGQQDRVTQSFSTNVFWVSNRNFYITKDVFNSYWMLLIQVGCKPFHKKFWKLRFCAHRIQFFLLIPNMVSKIMGCTWKAFLHVLHPSDEPLFNKKILPSPWFLIFRSRPTTGVHFKFINFSMQKIAPLREHPAVDKKTRIKKLEFK